MYCANQLFVLFNVNIRLALFYRKNTLIFTCQTTDRQKREARIERKKESRRWHSDDEQALQDPGQNIRVHATGDWGKVGPNPRPRINRLCKPNFFALLFVLYSKAAMSLKKLIGKFKFNSMIQTH